MAGWSCSADEAGRWVSTPSARPIGSYSALLYDGPDDQIAHTAEGQLCPDRAGGRLFTGRFDNGVGYGRFRDVSSGRGHVRVTTAGNGSATLTIAGHLRTG